MSSSDSFANLGRSANDTPEAPLPPAGRAIIKAFDLNLFPPKEDGKMYRGSLRVGFVAPAPELGIDPGSVDASEFESFFHTIFGVGSRRGDADLKKIAQAFGAGDVPMYDSDGNGGIMLTAALVEAVRGRECLATLKHGTNSQSGAPEVRLSKFAPLA